MDREKVIKADAVVLIKCIAKCRAEDKRILEHDDDAVYQCPTCTFYRHGCKDSLMERAINTIESLLNEQEDIKEQFIEAFNTIRDAYNAPANREKILLNYLARNACCCEQKKTLIDSGQFADMLTM